MSELDRINKNIDKKIEYLKKEIGEYELVRNIIEEIGFNSSESLKKAIRIIETFRVQYIPKLDTENNDEFFDAVNLANKIAKHLKNVDSHCIAEKIMDVSTDRSR